MLARKKMSIYYVIKRKNIKVQPFKEDIIKNLNLDLSISQKIRFYKYF